MLTCTFLRINDDIYNANCIKKIKIFDESLMSVHGPLCEIKIWFEESLDIPVMTFWTYFHQFGQIFYDWHKGKNNFFEIYYLTREEAFDENVKYLEDFKSEIEEEESYDDRNT